MSGLSLFGISQEYRSLIAELEANGGEITDGIAESLVVCQEGLEQKLSNYRKIIASLESEELLIKEEIERLKSTGKTKANTVKKLKEAALQAVIEFGDVGKSGNKVINLVDCKFFTRNTKIVEVDEARYKLLVEMVVDWLRGLNDLDMLINSNDLDISFTPSDIINRINENLKERDSDAKPFREGDLDIINIQILHEFKLSEIGSVSNIPTIVDYLNHEDTAQLSSSYNKILAKGYLQEVSLSYITTSNLGISTTLQIK